MLQGKPRKVKNSDILNYLKQQFPGSQWFTEGKFLVSNELTGRTLSSIPEFCEIMKTSSGIKIKAESSSVQNEVANKFAALKKKRSDVEKARDKLYELAFAGVPSDSRKKEEVEKAKQNFNVTITSFADEILLNARADGYAPFLKEYLSKQMPTIMLWLQDPRIDSNVAERLNTGLRSLIEDYQSYVDLLMHEFVSEVGDNMIFSNIKASINPPSENFYGSHVKVEFPLGSKKEYWAFTEALKELDVNYSSVKRVTPKGSYRYLAIYANDIRKFNKNPDLSNGQFYDLLKGMYQANLDREMSKVKVMPVEPRKVNPVPMLYAHHTPKIDPKQIKMLYEFLMKRFSKIKYCDIKIDSKGSIELSMNNYHTSSEARELFKTINETLSRWDSQVQCKSVMKGGNPTLIIQNGKNSLGYNFDKEFDQKFIKYKNIVKVGTFLQELSERPKKEIYCRNQDNISINLNFSDMRFLYSQTLVKWYALKAALKGFPLAFDDNANANQTGVRGFNVTLLQEGLSPEEERQITQRYHQELKRQGLILFKGDTDLLLNTMLNLKFNDVNPATTLVEHGDRDRTIHLNIAFPDYFTNSESEERFGELSEIFLKLGINFTLINDEATFVPTMIINVEDIKNYLSGSDSFYQKGLMAFKAMHEKEPTAASSQHKQGKEKEVEEGVSHKPRKGI